MGALTDKEFWGDVGKNAKDFLQSTSNNIAMQASVPVDAIAWALRKAGMPIPDAPLGGTDWMKNAGILRDVPHSPAAVAGEVVGGLAPTLLIDKAPKIAAGLNRMAENAMMPRTLNPQAGVVKVGDVDVSYRGGHTAPQKEYGAPLHELTKIYPDDIYSSKAARFYGHYGGGNPMDSQTIAMIQSLKGKPDAQVTMYRAVPYKKTIEQQISDLDKQMASYMKRGVVPDGAHLKGSDWYENASMMRERLASTAQSQAPEKLAINSGDWVTINRRYAKEHGESALGGDYKIISQKVPARKLFTDGNSIQEFGYDESGKALLEMLGLIGAGAGGAAYLSSGKNKQADIERNGQPLGLMGVR